MENELRPRFSLLESKKSVTITGSPRQKRSVLLLIPIGKEIFDEVTSTSTAQILCQIRYDKIRSDVLISKPA